MTYSAYSMEIFVENLKCDKVLIENNNNITFFPLFTSHLSTFTSYITEFPHVDIQANISAENSLSNATASENYLYLFIM